MIGMTWTRRTNFRIPRAETMMIAGQRPPDPGLLAIACVAIALGSFSESVGEQDGGSKANPRVIEGPSFEIFYAGRKLSDWVKLLEASDDGLRLGAARSLGDLGPRARPAVPWLIKALDDPDGSIRFAAAHSLGQIGADPAEVVPALARSLRKADGFTKGIIGLALARFGAAAIPTLLDATRDGDYRVRYEGVRALRLIGPAARMAEGRFVEMLEDSNPGNRVEAAYALWLLGPDRRWLDVLIRSLEDPDDFAQVTAASFLTSIGPEAEPAIPTLIRGLADPSDFAKGRSSAVLAAIGPRAVSAIPALLRSARGPNKAYLIRDVLVRIGPGAVPELVVGLDDPDVREAVAQALGRIGKSSSPALSRLRALMATAPPRDRVVNALAIWRIDGDRAVVPVLASVLLGDEFLPRALALSALEEIRADAESAIPTLIGILHHENRFTRQGAAKVLGAIGPGASGSIPALRAMLHDQETSNRIEAARALWRIERSRLAVDALAGGPGGSKTRHTSAVLALGEIGPEAGAALPALIEALEVDSIFGKAIVAEVLGKIGPAARVAVPRLVEIHNDLHNTERPSFAKAIKALDPEAAMRAGTAD